VSESLPFRVLESRDPDGVVRVVIEGELDISVSEAVSARLAQLVSSQAPVRLDLSGVEFMDSSGLRAIVVAVRSGGQLGNAAVEIDPEVSHQIRRLFALVGLSQLLGVPPVP
jgi:anti-sigma B factor antagonist